MTMGWVGTWRHRIGKDRGHRLRLQEGLWYRLQEGLWYRLHRHHRHLQQQWLWRGQGWWRGLGTSRPWRIF